MKPVKDIQGMKPIIPISLSRVGVTGIKKIVPIKHYRGADLFYSEMDLYADLSPEQKGLHMSRFSTIVNEIIDEVIRFGYMDIESFIKSVAEQINQEQKALKSEVAIRAKYPRERRTPVSGQASQEIYSLIGIAVSTKNRTRIIVGGEAQGMTACPCAQEMIREYSQKKLWEAGFTEEDIEKILTTVPLSSHNQRGEGTLLIGTDQKIDVDDLVDMVENSMSSQIYQLLKRPDEFFVVHKAHTNPMFVEDVVREMLKAILTRYPDLPDDSFVLAKQRNFETIHSHDVFAERYGTVKEIREELYNGKHLTRHRTMRSWLED
jgi:MptA/FolE2 family GTP cyclohydrolase